MKKLLAGTLFISIACFGANSTLPSSDKTDCIVVDDSSCSYEAYTYSAQSGKYIAKCFTDITAKSYDGSSSVSRVFSRGDSGQTHAIISVLTLGINEAIMKKTAKTKAAKDLARKTNAYNICTTEDIEI